MKKIIPLFLLLVGFSAVSVGQINTDSLLGKKYFFHSRLGLRIVKRDGMSIGYNPKAFWLFNDDVVLSLNYEYGYTHHFEIINQFGDTGYIKPDDIRQFTYDEYAMMSLPEFIGLQKKYPKSFSKLMNGRVEIGMTTEQLKIAKGVSDKINSTETAKSYSEQWVYRSPIGDEYYYLENGRITTIQN